MLDHLCTPDLIDIVLSNPAATELERALADRLDAAMDEIGRMTETIAKYEAYDGYDPRGES